MKYWLSKINNKIIEYSKITPRKYLCLGLLGTILLIGSLMTDKYFYHQTSLEIDRMRNLITLKRSEELTNQSQLKISESSIDVAVLLFGMDASNRDVFTNESLIPLITLNINNVFSTLDYTQRIKLTESLGTEQSIHQFFTSGVPSMKDFTKLISDLHSMILTKHKAVTDLNENSITNHQNCIEDLKKRQICWNYWNVILFTVGLFLILLSEFLVVVYTSNRFTGKISE